MRVWVDAMLSIRTSLAYQPYTDPWNQPYCSRFASLTLRATRAAYYYESVNNSTFRYRVYNMLQAIALGDYSSGSFFTSEDLPRKTREISSSADVLVIGRSGYTHNLESLMNQFKQQNKTVFFDIDDLVFEPEYLPLVLNTLNQDLNDSRILDYWFAYASRIRLVMDVCDHVITTNRYLADKVTEITCKKAYVIPNFLNREQIDYSKTILEYKLSKSTSNDYRFILGYFSGSPSHDKDFKVIEDTINQVMGAHKNVHLLIVGFLNLSDAFQSFSDRITMVPLVDFVNLQNLISQVDLNIVPLQINDFTNCKSELKYFEAAIVSTPTVASKSYTFSNAIHHEVDGFLANSYDWLELLHSIISSKYDLRNIAQLANESCIARYHYKHFTSEINRILFS